MRERRPHRFLVGGELHRVRVRESPRAQYARVSVLSGGSLEVVVPRGCTRGDVDELLDEKRRWIAREVARARERARPRLGLDRPGVVWLAGEPYPLEQVGLRTMDPAAVERWYLRRARERIEAAVRRERTRLGVRPRAVSVRDTQSQWGSCSAHGRLSFSWRLVLAPERVLDYLVVHELCHLRELNHSSFFWRLVAKAHRGWRADERWLEEHGDELRAYSPAIALVHPEPVQLALFAA